MAAYRGCRGPPQIEPRTFNVVDRFGSSALAGAIRPNEGRQRAPRTARRLPAAIDASRPRPISRAGSQALNEGLYAMIGRLIYQEEIQLASLRNCLPTAEALKLPSLAGLRQRISLQEARIRALQTRVFLASRS